MTYIISLTAQELQVIYQALGELPLKQSGPVFGKIDVQKREQDAAKVDTQTLAS